MIIPARKYTPAPGAAFRFTPGEIRVFKRREKLSTADWAARYRVVVGGAKPGPWRNELNPCARGIMDALDAPHVREVYVCAAPQSVKTQSIINYLLRRVDQDPLPATYVMPDEKTAKKVMRRRLIPTIRATLRLAELLSLRADDTTHLGVLFVNGMELIGAWASSPAALSSDAVGLMILDEMNKFPPPTGAEPDPFALAEQRTNSFPDTYKIYGASTPTDEAGLITRAIATRADELRYYEAKCPVCGEYQRMLWANISWGNTRDPREVLRKGLARYHCQACGMAWDDHRRNVAVLNGRWASENPLPRPRVVAFHLPSWYCQPMSRAVGAFLHGQDDPGQLIVWVTQHCAEPWRETIVKKSESIILKRVSGYPALIVPPEVVALTAGIDMQKHGFWFVVRGWTEVLTSYLVQYGFVGNWEDLETLLWQTTYRIHDTNDTMGIWRAGLDTGGGQSPDGDWSRTEEAYQWLKRQPPGKVFGTKGATHVRSQLAAKRIKESRLETFPSSNKPIPGGLTLRFLDTGLYKELLHWRLELEPGKPQAFYVHDDIGADYIKQLLSEERARDRRGKAYWKQVHAQNHILDCEIIAASLADREWIPSLQMLAGALLKQRLEQKNNPTAPPRGARRVISQGVE